MMRAGGVAFSWFGVFFYKGRGKGAREQRSKGGEGRKGGRAERSDKLEDEMKNEE